MKLASWMRFMYLNSGAAPGYFVMRGGGGANERATQKGIWGGGVCPPPDRVQDFFLIDA